MDLRQVECSTPGCESATSMSEGRENARWTCEKCLGADERRRFVVEGTMRWEITVLAGSEGEAVETAVRHIEDAPARFAQRIGTISAREEG